jgi:inner membrane protein
VAIGMAAARVSGAPGQNRTALFRSMVALSALSMLPDIDVVGFALGVPYGAPLGHRGGSHSLAVALAVGVLFGLAARADARATAARHRAACFGAVVALVAASHGLLDAMTDGGHGVALLWPFTTHRYFFGWRPIPVAPIGRAFFSSWGMQVAGVEVAEFAPFFLFALWPRRQV